MNNNQTMQEQYPKSTMELLKYIAKKIPERFLKALPLTIAFGVGAWILHTYLLVYKNEGFNPDTWLGMNLLNVKGRLISSTLLWTMMGIIIPMLLTFFKRGGNPLKSVAAIVKMPFEIVNKAKSTGGRFLSYVCFSCAVTLFFNGIFSGVTSALAGGIIMSSVLAFITGRGSIFIQILKMILNDIQMFILKKRRLNLDNNSIFMIIGSGGSILMIFGILKLLRLPWFLAILISYAWLAFAVLGIVLLFNNNKIPRQFMFFIGFIGSVLLFSDVLSITVFADDGGWRESGSTLGGWVRSQGAVPATIMGLPPAIGGLIGSYISTILGGLFEGLGPLIPDDISVTPPPQERIRLQQEQERIREEQEKERLDQEEFERRRQLEIKSQEQQRQKALEELNRIQKQREERQKYIDQLCTKYNTTPDKLRSVIQSNMDKSIADAQAWNDYDQKLAYAEAAAKITLVAADTAIDGLANATGPMGRGIRAGYKVTKNIAGSMAENGINKDAFVGGAVKGAADAATDFTENQWTKAGMTIAGETISGAATGGWEGAGKGLKNGVFSAGTNAITDKLAGRGYGNDMKPTVFHSDGTATVSIKSCEEWIIKNISGKNAIKFDNIKIGNQLTQSTVKGTSGLLNEMVIKPALGLN